MDYFFSSYLLTHKVLRKLENRYEIYLRDSLKELIDVIETQYGKILLLKV